MQKGAITTLIVSRLPNKTSSRKHKLFTFQFDEDEPLIIDCQFIYI